MKNDTENRFGKTGKINAEDYKKIESILNRKGHYGPAIDFLIFQINEEIEGIELTMYLEDKSLEEKKGSYEIEPYTGLNTNLDIKLKMNFDGEFWTLKDDNPVEDLISESLLGSK